ncbi:gene D protein [Yersinia intermedia]|nr:gene D protein [Yersinia intermedia]
MLSTTTLGNGARLSPDYQVRLNAEDITRDISPRLINLALADNRGFEADQLDIELDDADGQLHMPPRGAVLSVFLGWKGETLIGKGDFTVDEVEHRGAPDTLTIRARSADYRGTLNSRRDNSYHGITLGEIVGQVARRNNLTPMLAAEFKGVMISHIDQTQETDAKFITRLAELNGAVAAIKAGRLLLIKPGAGVTAGGKPIPQLTLSRSDGDRHQFSIADRGAYTGVSASWLHTKDPKPKKVKLQRKPKFKPLRALQHPAAANCLLANGYVSATHTGVAVSAAAGSLIQKVKLSLLRLTQWSRRKISLGRVRRKTVVNSAS